MKLAALGVLVAAMALAQHGPGMSHGGSRAGRSGGRFLTPPPIAHPAHAWGYLVPIPVYYGAGYYGYDPSVPLSAQSAPAYDANPSNYASSQSPVVVINQAYGNPDNPDGPPPDAGYSNFEAPVPAHDPEPTIYLIAMKDHSIVAAVGYWVQGDTLNYITEDGNQNQVSLALVDRDFSKQLNDDRHVEFRLPKQNQ
ncbi:MAG TPA: hypothetical protein VMG40_00785 [Bryobacteraceae bacterium]|nr:hypothetical protein [Bryobacteraceae bacterium]